MTLSDVLQPYGTMSTIRRSIASSQQSRILTILIFICLYVATAIDACPSACLCTGQRVYCKDKQLARIPRGIPANTRQLQLNKNNFRNTMLQRSNFTGIRSLTQLYLKECGIEVISAGTFSDLTSLEWLDLSDNKIRVIEANTFTGLSLRHLFLNGNGGLDLENDAFGGLSTNGLYLNSCTLEVLPTHVLRPLNSSLKSLWLDDNRIERFQPDIKDIFQNLDVLRLGGNPLHCSCETNWIKIFYDNHKGVFEGSSAPKCASPPKFRDRLFDTIEQHELRCELPKFDGIEVHIENGRGYLKCGATSDPAPTLTWLKPEGTRVTYNPPPTSRDDGVERNTAILNLDRDASKGLYRCIASNNAGDVTLTMNFSWPSGQSQTTPLTRDSSSTSSSSSTTFLTSTRGNKGSGKDVTVEYGSESERLDGMVQTSNQSEMSTSMFDTTFFTLTQFIGAIVGTFLGTLILSVVVMQLIYRRRRLRRARSGNTRTINGSGYHKPKPNNFYMTNLEDMDFMDIKGSPIRNT